MNIKLSNITNIWAIQTIKSLINGGVRHFCIAPGSRNAPLTLALAELIEGYANIDSQPIQLHSHFDERGIGFYALGIAKSTFTPVVVVTTSGTAVPNLHPAVVEAFQTHIPLIILSADRPPELLFCGANQAIQQKNLFGRNVIHFQQLALPSKAAPLQTLVDDINICLSYAQGLIDNLDRGPVHINCPFREPLYGNNQLSDHTDYVNALNNSERTTPTQPNIDNRSLPHISWSNQTIVIAGSLSTEESKCILAFAEATNLLVLADIGSQLRLSNNANILHYSDLLLTNNDVLDLLRNIQQVIQFGGRITSKRLNQWLGSFQGQYIIIDGHHGKLDPHHKAVQYRSSIKQFCDHADAFDLSPQIGGQLIALNKQINTFISGALQSEFSELSVARKISEILPKRTALFTGNSLAIRLMDMFASPKYANPVYSNRGASGIDGLLASALGCSINHADGMTLLIGDLSLLHDLNSLALAAKQDTPFIIVVLNNDGGSIFNLLPMEGISHVKKSFFQCPHGVNFHGVCEMFSISYRQPSSLKQFESDYLAATQQNSCTLIEVTVPSDQSTSQIKQLTQQISNIKC